MRIEVVILILLFLVIGLVFLFPPAKPKVSEADARQFVLEDLKNRYPHADVREIVSVEVKNQEGSQPSYWIKARVANNYLTPCPERLHLYYNYPEQNFVTGTPEEITPGCKVCPGSGECHVLFEEEAIIASHTFSGTEAVHQYLQDYNATPAVSYYPSYHNQQNVWVVNWDAPAAPYQYTVIIGKNTSIVRAVEKEIKG